MPISYEGEYTDYEVSIEIDNAVNRAVQEERDAIITIGLERLKNYSGHYLTQVLYQFIEAIRARSK